MKPGRIPVRPRGKRSRIGGVANRARARITVDGPVAGSVTLQSGEQYVKHVKRLELKAKKKRMQGLKRKFVGMSKMTRNLGGAFRQQTEPAASVGESLRRLFVRTMHLSEPQKIHDSLELAGKPNHVPQRFLLHPPQRGAWRPDSGWRQSAFDSAATQVSQIFAGNEDSQQHLREMLQIFTFYSSVDSIGNRGLGFSEFRKLTRDVKLAEKTSYPAKNERMCFAAFAACKDAAVDKTRIGLERFTRGFQALVPFCYRSDPRSPEILGNELLSKHIIARANRVRSNPVTLALLWSPEAQRIIAHFQWPLRIIFQHFASLNDDGARSNTNRQPDKLSPRELQAWGRRLAEDESMDWKEFTTLLRCFSVVGPFPHQLTNKVAFELFQAANLSEIADADVDRLSWTEYIEALGRCALRMHPLAEDGGLGLTGQQVSFEARRGVRTTAGLKQAVQHAFSHLQVGEGCFASPGQGILKRRNPLAKQCSPRAPPPSVYRWPLSPRQDKTAMLRKGTEWR